jgi:hypothetical protein
MENGFFLWIWLLFAPLVLAVVSLFVGGDPTHYRDRTMTRRDDLPRA